MGGETVHKMKRRENIALILEVLQYNYNSLNFLVVDILAYCAAVNISQQCISVAKYFPDRRLRSVLFLLAWKHFVESATRKQVGILTMAL